MNTSVKLAAFALGLVATFGAAAGVGAAVGPVGAADGAASAAAHGDMGAETPDAHDEGGHPAAVPAGLAMTDDGYTLRLADRSLPAGAAVPVAFGILGPD